MRGEVRNSQNELKTLILKIHLPPSTVNELLTVNDSNVYISDIHEYQFEIYKWVRYE